MEDTSYDTSVASMPEKRGMRTHSPALETDIEESDTELPRPAAAQRMRGRGEKPAPLFFSDESEEEVADERQGRMDRLRELARQRAALNDEQEEEKEPAAPEPRPSPPLAESSEDEAPAPKPQVKGLSRKDQREMHSMSARLRREQRATLSKREPKRYQLSELLSTIQHSESAPQSSSDPVESSSTPDRVPAPRSRAHTPPRTLDPFPDLEKERAQRKWAMLQAQSAQPDSDSDVEVVALTGPSKRPRAHFRAPPRDSDRAEADQQLYALGARPRTPRRQRISTDEYRSPNAAAPDADVVGDKEMDAAAHSFALAAHKVAGTLAPSSPIYADDGEEQPHSSPHRKHVPVVMDLAQLNATVLRKSYEQNAKIAAMKQGKAKSKPKEQPEEPEQAQELEQAEVPQHAQELEGPVAPEKHQDDTPPSSQEIFVHQDDPSDTERHTNIRRDSASSQEQSEKENVPLSPIAQDDPELDVDLGRFFAPTQRPSLSEAPLFTEPEPASMKSARTDSNSSVLAQFFESTQDGPTRGASLDLFANQQREGPVGGMTQFFDPTPSASARPTRSQEAMPPPSRARSSDGFAALRRAQQEEAKALLSPELLPSLDESLAERDAESFREAQAPRGDDMMYINQDGFFTQTKPAEFATQVPPASQRMRAKERKDEWASQADDVPDDAPNDDAPASDHESEASDVPQTEVDADADAALSKALSGSDTENDEEDDVLSDASHHSASSDVQARWKSILAKPKARRPERSAFVYGEAEESDEDEPHRGEHGGLGGVFSDRGSGSEPEEDSDDDADLESLLDDERDEDEDERDEAARQRYLQHREEDDAAATALHERAIKGMLRSRRRRLDDPLAELLDEDADEDELRRKMRAPSFQAKRRRIDKDGLEELAERDDSQAFVRTYTETHATEDADRYDFLGEASSDEERVTARDLRAEIRRHALQADEEEEEAPSETDEDVSHKLHARRPTAPRPADDEDAEYARLVFRPNVDAKDLPREVQERRAKLLEEYSNEPNWRQERGGRSGIDRRRTGQSKRASVPTTENRMAQPTRSAPSVLVHNVLRREAHFRP